MKETVRECFVQNISWFRDVRWGAILSLGRLRALMVVVFGLGRRLQRRRRNARAG